MLWECGLDSSGWGYGPVVGSREHDSEPSSYIKAGIFCPSEQLLVSKRSRSVELVLCIQSVKLTGLVVGSCCLSAFSFLILPLILIYVMPSWKKSKGKVSGT